MEEEEEEDNGYNYWQDRAHDLTNALRRAIEQQSPDASATERPREDLLRRQQNFRMANILRGHLFAARNRVDNIAARRGPPPNMPGHRPIVDGLSHLPAIIPQQVGEVEVREVPGGLNPNLGNLPLLRAARVIPPTRQGVREVRPIRGVPRGLLWGTGVRGRRGR